MANRYWVGGSGNWSSTANWSTTNGGASGASVPGVLDDVFFTQFSGSVFVATVNTAQSVNSITIDLVGSVGPNLRTTISLAASLTTNNFSVINTSGNNRTFITSDTYGLTRNFFTINGTVNISDVDFRDVYVNGTAAPISGTRIGNRGGCTNITFSAPKTVYWNSATGSSSSNVWASTATGSPSPNNFPLPQDTATFTNSGATPATVSLDAIFLWMSGIDMSARTNALTISIANAFTIYGNWTNGSGTTISGINSLTFSGGTTQTITSAGKTFTCPITIDTYGGTVQLGDALSFGGASGNALTITNGTFDTKNYNVNVGALVSNNSNVRTINLGSSTITLSTANTQIDFTTSTNLTFNAGTSTINSTSSSSTTLTTNFGGLSYYNFSITLTNAFGNYIVTGNNTFNTFTFSAASVSGTTASVLTFSGSNIFANLTINATSFNALRICNFSNNQTITGTLTCAGASSTQRIFLRSDTLGTQRTLTVNSISATDCDFRDINLAGTASGASPTRAGNCGGNSGITFSSKTVYWNLAGTQNWSANGWAATSGGSPATTNFPLAQDTAIFNNSGSAGTVTINYPWNIGTFDASARTSAMTLTTSTNAPFVYGDWKFGTGVTSSSTTGIITFAKNGTQTITSNGVQFGCPVTVNHPSGTVQLADALSLNSLRRLNLTAGTFDAVTYNVTIGQFNCDGASSLKMGSGTWTLSGTDFLWNLAVTPIITVGTSTIVLSDTSTSARTFGGGTLYYNKLTIGGTTGTSTLTITGNFGELASTKTVAHTITFSATVTYTIGKWSVTGTLGNVVTVNTDAAGTAFTLSIAGPANTGIDYLSVQDCTVSSTSPGEFYVGANSTNVSGNTRVIFTATPAARTLYWVGGTGNWSDTARWSTSSGGASGAAIPTSLDAVIFNSASNATAYTATIDTGVLLARCASFTMAGPASGNVTFAGSRGIAFHGNVSFAATGITNTYTGSMQWAGNSSYTFTSNGLSFAPFFLDINGVNATWTLGSALTTTSSVNIVNGTFSTSASNYAVSCTTLSSSNTNANVRSISLNGSTLFLSGNPVLFSTTANLTFTAGTSTLSCSSSAPSFDGNGLTFYNVSFTDTASSTIAITINGANIFNTLSFAGRGNLGVSNVTFSANQTIATLTLNAGPAAAYRTMLASNTIGTQRTLTVTTLTAGAADYDFRDIAISGAAAPIAPTRAGDCKGNSGITFPAAKTVYWARTSTDFWGSVINGSWSATSGGARDPTQFPLAQDTAVFPAATYPASGSTTTINWNYNIGTIDMSLRTTNTMTLATGSNIPTIYGHWINGTGITLTGANTITFAGRGTQNITCAGVAWAALLTINTPGGSVVAQDAFTANQSSANVLTITQGTFNASTYNVTLSGAAGGVNASGTGTRTIAVGSGTWTISGTSGWAASTSTNLTVTGTGTISLTSGSAKTFAGGGANYSSITLNQGGAGTLTITGNNTFKNITNTYSATGATTIALGSTTQTVTQFTGTGTSAKLLTITGTSAASPGTLIMSGSAKATTSDYLTISNVRAYNLSTTWYAGANSFNTGSFGWIFSAAPVVGSTGNFFSMFQP